MRKTFLFIIICSIAFLGNAQNADSKWSLRRCVEYAMKNNISVKQADVQARITALQAKQANLDKYPNISASAGAGAQFGRSIDRTTNVYSNTQSIYQNFGLNGSIQVFNWGALKNNAQAAQFNLQAALTDVEKSANDVAINVANYYLQILASREQIKISEVQIAQTAARLSDTKKRVDAGSLPELNLAQLEAQLSTDSSTLITSRLNYDLSILSMKALLNIDAGAAFELDNPDVDAIPLDNIADVQPETVYKIALNNQPEQKGNEFRLKAAQKNIQVAKAAFYPVISLGVNLGTNFYSSFDKLTGYQITPTPSGIVNVGGTDYTVYSPNYQAITGKKNFGQLWDGYGNQINNNFGQTVGFSVSIPIFNNGRYKINYQQSKLQYRNVELRKEQSDQTLKQNIYTAYTNAAAAMQKFFVGKKNVESAQKVYDYSVKRYDAGILGTLDLLINQNSLLSAKLQQLNNQYDYIFRMKLLEFYKGQGLKL